MGVSFFQFEKELVKERDAKAEVKRDLEASEASLAKFKKEYDNVKDSERQRREKEEGVRKLLHEAESKLLLAREMEDKVISSFNTQYSTLLYCSILDVSNMLPAIDTGA